MLEFLISILLVGSLFVLYQALRYSREVKIKESVLARNLERLNQRKLASLQELEMAAQASAAAVKESKRGALGLGQFGDFLSHIAESLMVFIPGGVDLLEAIDRKLLMAGRPSRMRAEDYIVFSLVIVAIAGVFALFLHAIGLSVFVSLAVVAIALYYVATRPTAWAKDRISRARSDLPSVIDATIVALSGASPNLITALRLVTRGTSERWRNKVLVQELSRVLEEVETLRRPIPEALRAMGERMGAEEIRSFANTLASIQEGAAGLENLRQASDFAFITWTEEINDLIEKSQLQAIIGLGVQLLALLVVLLGAMAITALSEIKF